MYVFELLDQIMTYSYGAGMSEKKLNLSYTQC
jgi:hypothetical protein